MEKENVEASRKSIFQNYEEERQEQLNDKSEIMFLNVFPSKYI